MSPQIACLKGCIFTLDAHVWLFSQTWYLSYFLQIAKNTAKITAKKPEKNLWLLYDLRTHLKMHSGEKPNKCNQCDYASSRVGDLRAHLNKHNGEKSQKCNQCDYASSHAGHLRTHLKTHSGEKSNKCNQCDYASSQASTLRTHLKTHRGVKNALWLCLFWGMKFEDTFENKQ